MMPERAETPETATDEDIVRTFHDIVLAGELLTDAMHRRMPAMDGHGLAPFVLRAIQDAGRRGLSQVEIARHLGRSSSAATRLIDGMEKAEIVVRSPHPNDRRVNMILLTPKGDELVNSIFRDLARSSVGLQAMSAREVDAFRTQISDCAKIASIRLREDRFSEPLSLEIS